ncbi:MAG: flagellar motor switch protein FliM [Pseudomonadota bacterium]|nr:flagellar motor switch protein FliM [Pseudomonadota bacterium]
MAEEEVLTQEEIDELLHTVNEEDDSQQGLARADAKATPFDFALQARVFRDHLPTLEVIHDKVARGLRAAVQGWLQRTVDVAAQPMRAVKYQAYARSLAFPTAMHAYEVKGFQERFLICVPAALVSALVEGFFGGSGAGGGGVQGRDLSRTERRIAEMLVGLAQREVTKAWGAVHAMAFTAAGMDTNPQFADHHAAEEPVLIHSYGLEMDCGGGEIQLVYPWRALEPLRDKLAGGGPQQNQAEKLNWNRELRRDLVGAPVKLTARFAEAVITLADLMSLEAGDVIPIELPEQIVIASEGIPLFRAGYGTQEGHYAIQIHDLLQVEVDSPPSGPARQAARPRAA